MLEYTLTILICLVLSAFFSGSETALLRINPSDLDDAEGKEEKLSTHAAKSLLHSPSKLLVTILFGNNVVNLLGAACASTLFVNYFGEKSGVLVSTIVMTVTVLIFSEIFPKAVASRNPVRVSKLVSLPLYMIHNLCKPMHYIFENFLDPFIVRMAGSEKDSSDVNAYDSLLRIASQIREHNPKLGPISIIQSTVKAQNLAAEDVMIPKTDIFALSHNETNEKALEAMLANRYTRAPVYKDSLDSMIGIVHFKDLVEAAKHGSATLKQILRPVLRVPERKPILSLLSDMQNASIHMAIVKNEFGGTLGLLTQEDILEELVGEIRDEFDSEELSSINQESSDTYRVLGKISVRDFNRNSGWNILAAQNETIGGLLFNQIGRIPRVGDSITIDNYLLKVIEMSGHKISQVKIKNTNPSTVIQAND